jgi:dTDP-4-amino-4,6-dideoxygalactose transaminase
MTARSRVPFVDLTAQYAGLRDELERDCARALAQGDYVLGADVAAFEQEFARYCGVRHGVGVDSGTSAIELALRAFDVGPGHEVITAANTFVGTTFAIAHTGARPVLVDVDPRTHTIDPAAVSFAITPRTRAIVPVHLYGQCAAMTDIVELARKAGLAVVEDACQAHGSRYRGRHAGSLGDAAAFSFYPAKNLGAAGDGGIVVTDDMDVAEQVRVLRNYGQRVKYRSECLGHNHRLDTLQASILRVKLRHLDGWNRARRTHAASYHHALDQLPLVRPEPAPDREHVWHVYGVRVPRREAVRAHLARRGIETGIHYPVPAHLQPAHRALGYREGDFPVTELYAEQILSLPMYPELPAEAIRRVAAALGEAIERATGEAERATLLLDPTR